MARISSNQAAYIRYVESHQGCMIAEVNRACRNNRLAGHRWVYDSVHRLLRRGLLVCLGTQSRTKLYTPEYAAIILAAASDATAGADENVPARYL